VGAGVVTLALGDVFQAMDIPPDLVDDKQASGTLNRLKAAIQKPFKTRSNANPLSTLLTFCMR
jgi:hypothetical protein